MSSLAPTSAGFPDSLRQAAIRSITTPAVVPSILNCDFARVKDEIQAVESIGATMLHLDVMDGHFVPNISFGPPVIECIRRVTSLPLDTHLMISQPERYLDAFLGAGSDILTIHVEAVAEPRGLLDAIRHRNLMAGIALNPPTPVSAVRDALLHADLVLVMSVMPGFGGQEFQADTLAKVSELRAMAPPQTVIEMDGGLNRRTIAAAAAAGVQFLVVGSALFRAQNYADTFSDLGRLAREASIREAE